MRQKTITQLQINKICEGLRKKDIKVTVARVRGIAKTGSNTTLSHMVAQWKSDNKITPKKQVNSNAEYKRGYKDALKLMRGYMIDLAKNVQGKTK